MTTRRLLVLIVAAMAISSYWMLSPTSAQNGGVGSRPISAGVVDVAQVIRQSKELADVKVKLQDQRDAFQKEVGTRTEELKTMEAALKQLVAGTPDYENTLNEFYRERIRFQAWVEETKQKLLRKHLDHTDVFYRKLLQAIEDIARTENLDLVLYRESYDLSAKGIDEMFAKIQQKKVLYRSTRIDLTDKVLKKMDAEYKPGG